LTEAAFSLVRDVDEHPPELLQGASPLHESLPRNLELADAQFIESSEGPCDSPDPCDKKCENAYAWALSAFASGAWQRGEVP
jgi:hypothetical protein